MEIEVLHHVSLQVTDLGRSQRFYAEVLGLEQIERPPLPVAGVWFRIGDRELHLIDYSPTAAGANQPLDIRRTHFAIRVRSYAAALAQLRRLGYRDDAPADDPHRLLAGPQSRVGYPQLYIQDPDGHMIEINAAKLDA